jgi:hypothetical protein
VGWTKLAVEGAAAVDDTPYFRFGRTETRCLVGSILLAVFVFGPGGIGMLWAYYSGWAAVPLTVAVTVLLIEVVVGWRFTFVLTTLALDRYQGVKEAWYQTKGMVLRLLGVILLSGIPLNLIRPIELRIGSSAVIAIPALIPIWKTLDVTVLFLHAAVSAGAIALCYRFRTVGIAESEAPDRLLCRYCRNVSPLGSNACSNCGLTDGLERWRM